MQADLAADILNEYGVVNVSEGLPRHVDNFSSVSSVKDNTSDIVINTLDLRQKFVSV